MFDCGLCNFDNKARFLQLDTAGTESSPGYDPYLREPNLVSSGPDDPIGSVGRVNTAHELVCQVEVTQFSDRLRQSRQGKSRDAKYEITVPRRTLFLQDLIDVNGESKIRTGAQVEKIVSLSGSTVLAFPNPPGLFVEDIEYAGWDEEGWQIAVFVCTPRERAL